MKFKDELLKDSERNERAEKSTVEQEVIGWGETDNDRERDIAMHVQYGKVFYVRQEWCNNMVAAYQQHLANGGTMAEFNGKLRKISSPLLKTFDLGMSVVDRMLNFGTKGVKAVVNAAKDGTKLATKVFQNTNQLVNQHLPSAKVTLDAANKAAKATAAQARKLGNQAKKRAQQARKEALRQAGRAGRRAKKTAKKAKRKAKKLRKKFRFEEETEEEEEEQGEDEEETEAEDEEVEVEEDAEDEEWQSYLKNRNLECHVRSEWDKEKEFWRSTPVFIGEDKKDKKKYSVGMAKQTDRAPATETAFRKFYVEYMEPFQPKMREWCAFASKLDDYYVNFNKSREVNVTFSNHTGDEEHPFDTPGFFPSLIDFTEWIDQGREEKYRRSWATPLVRTGDRVLNLNSDHTQTFNLDFTFNIAVSMDVKVPSKKDETGEDVGFFVLRIDNLVTVRVDDGSLQLLLDGDNRREPQICSGVPFKSAHKKSKKLHLEVVLTYDKDAVDVLIDGVRDENCFRTGVEWTKDHSRELGRKRVRIGGKLKQSSDRFLARNVEIRTWEDPPVCCSDWNNGDGKCIRAC